jgi:hypothetical protein
MRLPSGLRALRHRDYRRFYIGQLVSLVGNWMQSVAQAWLVLDLTHSAFKLGPHRHAPVHARPGLLRLRGRARRSRPKRRMLITTQIALAVQAVTLAALVVSGRVEYWHVCVLGFLLGCVNTVDLPTASRSSWTWWGRPTW